ncbi:MAG: radical SAM protein [Muribaculaceae bacterium]|nr:radical SAM protein [Muribaculaceae bacterium]
MQLAFITPPVFVGKRPAERSAGCTHVVYLAPNIYELTVVAMVEQSALHQVTYRDFVSDNIGPKGFVSWLKTDNSEVYLMWTVNLSIDNDLEVIRHIRLHRPGAKVVLMGPGPTHFTQRCLPDDDTVVVRGEPELTVARLLDAWHRGEQWNHIEGISYRTNGQVVDNSARPLMRDLDTLPLPARQHIAHRSYYNPKLKCEPYTTAFTSRNCPYHCIYCVPSSLTFAREIEHRRHYGCKPPIAMRSVESVDHEMRQIHHMGYRAVGFMDDNFIWNEQRTLALCEVMRRYGLVWGCQARVDAITPTIAQALAGSGCRYVDLGVESFDDKILEYIKKGITSEQIYRAIDLLKQHGVPVKLNILIGCSPLETPQTVKHTLREAQRLDVDQVMFNIVSPFPGTEYYRICKQNGWIATGDYVPSDVQRTSILNLPNLSARQMERALFYNNISYFLSPRFVWHQLRQFTSWRQFVHACRALRVKLFG